MNRRDAKAIEGVFTTDGSWELTGIVELRVEGAAEIAATILSALQSMQFLMQFCTAIVPHIEAGGHRATARSSLIEHGQSKETGKAILCAGIYTDDLIKQNDEWRFQSRLGQLTYWRESEADGKVCPLDQELG